MPTTSSANMSSDGSAWERTILYPPKGDDAGSSLSEPKAGTSSRRQFLVQTTGPRMRPHRVLEFPAESNEVTLGKGASCPCRIEEPGVADVHAALVRRVNRGVYLVDLSEGARTLLNGEPVREEVLLMDGDRITLGDSVQFEFMDGPRVRLQGWAKRVLLSAAGIRKPA